MDIGQLIFHPSPASPSPHGGHMLLMGSAQTFFRGEEGANKRRPFFTTIADEMMEEELYEQLQPEKKRRLTPDQVRQLELSFDVENKLEPEKKSELARQLGLQPRQVAVWFQNRRARWKNKRLEHDFDRLRAAYEVLLVDHHELLNDNHRLHAQVMTMAEELRAKETEAKAPSFVPSDGNDAGADCALDINRAYVKVEDMMSTAMDAGQPAVGEGSGDSMPREAVGGVWAEEEEEGSNDGCNYLMAMLFSDNHPNAVEENDQESAATVSRWWTWS